jgi:sarcosine oxidase subunit delta
MLLIPCPYCGPRPELEFSYGGEAHIARPVPGPELSAEQWTAFQYERSNTKGPHAERWRHTHGCARFFNVVRDTTTDRILRSYRSGER